MESSWQDKLAEKEDLPPTSSPHHRTSQPRRSSMKNGTSDGGMDPLPLGITSSSRASSLKDGVRDLADGRKYPSLLRPHPGPPPRPLTPLPAIMRRSASMNGLYADRSTDRDGERRRASHGHSKRASLQETPLSVHGSDFGNRRSRRKAGDLGHPVYMGPDERVMTSGVLAPWQTVHPHLMAGPGVISPPIPIQARPLVNPLPPPALMAPPVGNSHLRQRRRFLKYYSATLCINATHALLSEQVAPLNPVLAVPPPLPSKWLGSKLEELLQDRDWILNWRARKNPLPAFEWDVRTLPLQNLEITAWPYIGSTLAEYETRFPNEADMRTRRPVDGGEVRRFLGQTVTNPPSSFIVLKIYEDYAIKVSSAVPRRWVCVQDVLEAVYVCLQEPLDPSHDLTVNRRYETLKGERYIWAGLRRDKEEARAGIPVRELATGEIDGGCWDLVLRKA